MIKQTRAGSDHVLVLDAGNALWGLGTPTEQTEGRIQIEAMNLLQYDAMALGDLDLLLGPEALRQRIAEAQFPILSANVRVGGEEELLTKPYIISPMGDHRVGIIGLTWDGAGIPPGQFTLLPASDVLTELVAQIASEAEIIIVLSTMGFEEDQALSSMVPGIDLIVGGRSRIPMPESWVNPDTGTILVQAGTQGEWIGRRILSLDSAGVVTAHQDELVFLTDDYDDDPEMRSFLDNYGTQ